MKAIFNLRLLFIFALMFVCSQSVYAYTLKISRTVVGGNGSGYATVTRNVSDVLSQFEPYNLIQRNITIMCFDPGTTTCVTSIVASGDNSQNLVPGNVITYAQTYFNTYCASLDASGQIPSPVNQTVLGNDSVSYVVNISSTLEQATGKIVTELTITPVL